jgi:hypothetical protein
MNDVSCDVCRELRRGEDTKTDTDGGFGAR